MRPDEREDVGTLQTSSLVAGINRRGWAWCAFRPKQRLRSRAAMTLTYRDDVLCGWALLSLHYIELDALAFDEALESAALNRRVMDKHIFLAVIARDETKAFAVVEPLYCSCYWHSVLRWV
jgi:NO-binding membrane sensor protein with MHYT domain